MSFEVVKNAIVAQFGESAIVSSHEAASQPFIVLKTELLLEVCAA